jgi:hypothetical protein
MTAQTGRTHSKWIYFIVDDSAGTLRNIPVNSINGIGLTYDEMDVTAFQDAIKNSVLGHPDAPIEISGPLDSSAAAAVPSLSGSHTVLSVICGANTPLSLDIQVGVRHAWESGEPQFGITSSAVNGYLCSAYTVDPSSMTYSAKFVLSAGSAAPAWGTAAET